MDEADSPAVRRTVGHAVPCQALNDLRTDFAGTKADVSNLIGWQSTQNGYLRDLGERERETRDAVMATTALIDARLRETVKELRAEVRDHQQRVYLFCGATLLASLVAAGPNAGSLLGSVFKALFGGGP